MRAEITITGNHDSNSMELRLANILIDSTNKLVCVDIVDISEVEDRLVGRLHVNAEELYEASRMFVARVGKVTARY